MQLSEPLLWYILKVLDNEESVSVFTAMGGVKVLCENLVNSNNGSSSSGLSSPGVIALVMQHFSNAPNLAASASTSSKKASNTLESGKDSFLNFAPLGTVSWVKPMVEPADVLIQSAAPHRCAITAAWSYHFFPGESWVDLTPLLCLVRFYSRKLNSNRTCLRSEVRSSISLVKFFIAFEFRNFAIGKKHRKNKISRKNSFKKNMIVYF